MRNWIQDIESKFHIIPYGFFLILNSTLGTKLKWRNTFQGFFYYKDNMDFCSFVFTIYRWLSMVYFIANCFINGRKEISITRRKTCYNRHVSVYTHPHEMILIFGLNIQRQRHCILYNCTYVLCIWNRIEKPSNC